MRKFWKHQPPADDLLSSQLYDQNIFYKAFLRDITACQEELIIESPFITARRMNMLYPTRERLRQRGVRIIINTRDPNEHDDVYKEQATNAGTAMQELGIVVIYMLGITVS